MNPQPSSWHKYRSRRVLSAKAFTLIEVCLAIGIVAFALVPLMLMVPTGLKSQHQAIDSTLEAQIVQKVASDAEQADFDSLVTTTTVAAGTITAVAATLPDRYFDNQASELLKAADGTPDSANTQRLYDVVTTAVVPTSLPVSSSNTTPTSSNLATIKIQIASNPGRIADLSHNKLAYNTFFIYIARNEGLPPK